MKRRFLIAALGALTAMSALAVPAKRITRTVTQPDGSTVTLTLRGDESCHSFVTSDGLAVEITPEGHAMYRSADGKPAMYVSELAARSAAERSYIEANRNAIEFSRLWTEAKKLQAPRSARAGEAPAKLRRNEDGTVSIESGSSQVPHKGVAHVPIILAQYTDVKFLNQANAKETFEEFFMTGAKSAHKYFQDASLGNYDPQFHVIGPVNLSKNRAYYGRNVGRNDANVGGMVKEAIELADPTTDFSIFDNDGDGVMDVVIVLYAGVGEASSGVAEAVWPCQWTLPSAGYSNVRVDGVKANDFAVFNEVNGTYRNKIDGPGTFCHEFSHCLGLPDFYDVDYSGYFGMGPWSLMDYGSYNDDGYTPIGYSAYEKAFLGWLYPKEGKKNDFFTLPVLNDENAPSSEAVILVNDRDNNEYFFLENRKRQGWDQYMAADGMMIHHITYSAGDWSYNTVNDDAFQHVTLVPADNKLDNYTLSGDLWPNGGSATEFTNTSSPAATVHTGSLLNKPVTDITSNTTTGEISFWVNRNAPEPVDMPDVAETIVDETGTFTASWAPVDGGETDVTYTLQYWEHVDDVLTPEVWQNFENDGTGDLTWERDGYMQEYKASLVLGSGALEGHITSPCQVQPEGGIITVAAKAKNYSTDTGCCLVASLIDKNGNIIDTKEADVPKSNDPAYFTFAFDNLSPTGKYAVKLGNKGLKKRIMLYNVMAFSGFYADSTPEEFDAAVNHVSEKAPRRVETSVSASGRTLVTGITDTSYKVTGLTGQHYDYRVKAVPVDNTKAEESQWTEVKQVDVTKLTEESAIESVEAPRSGYHIIGGEVVATPGARLFTPGGAEVMPVAPGRFAPARGVYILVTPGLAPAKIML